MKTTLFFVSILLLIAVEISRVYFIMPFPGSQKTNSITYAYWIHNNIAWIRIVLLAIIVYTTILVWPKSRVATRISIATLALFYAVIFYFFNFRFQADKMFLEPTSLVFATSADNKVDGRKLILGIVHNGEARAYPIQVLGYHHQIRDSIDDTPLMVTYCTVCRTGRAFSPMVNGRAERFRLVGMDHFNAMFEDASTGSWWQQATGVAIVGPLKGSALKELTVEQSTLGMWLTRHPDSRILQPDTLFSKQYAALAKFDDGTTPDALEKRDSASWTFKSWVIGVEHNGHSKAYDWNALVNSTFIQDSMPGLPLLLALENDTATFRVLDRRLKNTTLRFAKDSSLPLLRDVHTGSLWTASGTCVSGPLEGEQLATVRSSQEFWHSWKTFHPLTEQHKN